MKYHVRRTSRIAQLALVAFSGGALTLALSAVPASAATSPDLGTAAAASVVAATTVTNTGATVLSGNLDLYPGTSVTGFPPGIVQGTQNVGGAVGGPANVAANDVTAAYLAALNAPATATMNTDLGGLSLSPGVYAASSGLSLTGTVTLVGSASSVFIFKSVSTLITGPGSSVVLSGGVQPCNIVWQVGSSATIGTTSAMVGNVLALTSISMATGATLQGRALARNGGVTLDGNTITSSVCSAATGGTTTTSANSTATTTTSTSSTTTVPVSPPTTTPIVGAGGATTTVPPLTSAPVTGGGPLSGGSAWPWIGFSGILFGAGLLTVEGIRHGRQRRAS